MAVIGEVSEPFPLFTQGARLLFGNQEICRRVGQLIDAFKVQSFARLTPWPRPVALVHSRASVYNPERSSGPDTEPSCRKGLPGPGSHPRFSDPASRACQANAATLAGASRCRFGAIREAGVQSCRARRQAVVVVVGHRITRGYRAGVAFPVCQWENASTGGERQDHSR